MTFSIKNISVSEIKIIKKWKRRKVDPEEKEHLKITRIRRTRKLWKTS